MSQPYHFLIYSSPHLFVQISSKSRVWFFYYTTCLRLSLFPLATSTCLVSFLTLLSVRFMFLFLKFHCYARYVSALSLFNPFLKVISSKSHVWFLSYFTSICLSYVPSSAFVFLIIFVFVFFLLLLYLLHWYFQISLLCLLSRPSPYVSVF